MERASEIIFCGFLCVTAAAAAECERRGKNLYNDKRTS
jgi:hypothetical protein